jgi:hypothetical protein
LHGILSKWCKIQVIIYFRYPPTPGRAGGWGILLDG